MIVKKQKTYSHQVRPPYEIRKGWDRYEGWVLVYNGVHILKKLLAQSEDGRDREAIIRIKEFENEL